MADTQQAGAQHITDADFDAVVLQSSKPVLVDFYATWCGPCKMAAPILDELSADQQDVRIVKLDVDENPQTTQQFGVSSIPTVVMFKDGKEVDRKIGFAGRQGYEDMIDAVVQS